MDGVKRKNGAESAIAARGLQMRVQPAHRAIGEGKTTMKHEHYDVLDVPGGHPVKMWTRGVPVEDEARRQLASTARMPFIYKHMAAMPDVHLGKGSTIGSVIPTLGAVIPAAVGVDIGC